jgi:DNA-binding transcriptional LysR family regulator
MRSVYNLRIDTINIVAEALNLRSVALAAGRLNMSESGVALHVAKFEQALGVTLFVDAGQGRMPVLAASTILAACRRILEEAVNLSHAVQKGRAMKRRLGLSPEVYSFLIHQQHPVLAEFSRSFSLYVADVNVLEQQRQEGAADIWAAPTLPGPDRHDFSSPLDFRWAGHVDRREDPPANSPLQIVDGADGSFLHTAKTAFFATRHLSHVTAAQAQSLVGISMHLQRTGGICLLPGFLLEPGCFGLVPIQEPELPVGFSAVFPCQFSCRYRADVMGRREAAAIFKKLCDAIGLPFDDHLPGQGQPASGGEALSKQREARIASSDDLPAARPMPDLAEMHSDGRPVE